MEITETYVLQEDQKLNHNTPISPPGKGRGELEITDVNNYYINQGLMGYKVLDGCLPRCGDGCKFIEGGDDDGDRKWK
jgi:hypothetical protein